MHTVKDFAPRLRTLTLTLGLAALLSACGGGGDGAASPSGAPGLPGRPGQSGMSALVRTSAEPAGVNCAVGGVRIQAGLDVNSSGVLDDGEVKETTFVCNGVAGVVGVAGAVGVTGPAGAGGAPGASSTALLRTDIEPAGANCASGGVRIQSGLDRNANDLLDDSEVRLTSYACNGAAGTSASPTGPAGPAGTTGPAGTPGTLSPAGPSGATGAVGTPGTPGTPGLAGPSGAPGAPGAPGASGTPGLTSLVRTTPEAAGANCAAGGQLVQAGLDANSNGALDVGEVQSSVYACNGVAGVPGATGTPGATGATGAIGAAGPAGLNSLIRTAPQPAGANCAAGGLRVQVGPDTSRDGVLQTGEVTSTDYVCSVAAAAAKAWQTAQLIETNNLGTASNPQIAFDASGNAIAVWQQADGPLFNVWANRYTPAAGWGAPALIETDNAGAAFNPQIAVDGSGNALAVWQQFDGTNNNIWANRFTPAGGWGTASLIETDNTGSAGLPQIAFDTGGNAIAVWMQSDGALSNIWANRFTPAGGWGAPAMIETDNAGSAFSPQIAIDASGNAMAVWSQSDGTRFNIWANRFTPAGGWGVATLIETDNAGTAQNPQIALDATGNAMAVWMQSDGTRFNIWANRFTAAGGWGSVVLIEADSGNAGSPQISIDAGGNAIAVWAQFDSTRSNIWSNRFTPAAGWGAPALIETDNAGAAFNPQIAFDGSGNGMAVWYQSDGARSNIWAARFTPAGGWGGPAMIETDNAGNALNSQIGFDGSGNALAVWQQSDGTRDNIWANRFR